MCLEVDTPHVHCAHRILVFELNASNEAGMYGRCMAHAGQVADIEDYRARGEIGGLLWSKTFCILTVDVVPVGERLFVETVGDWTTVSGRRRFGGFVRARESNAMAVEVTMRKKDTVFSATTDTGCAGIKGELDNGRRGWPLGDQTASEYYVIGPVVVFDVGKKCDHWEMDALELCYNDRPAMQ